MQHNRDLGCVQYLCATCPEKRVLAAHWSKKKKKQLVNTAVGLHAAATRLIHLNSSEKMCVYVRARVWLCV